MTEEEYEALVGRKPLAFILDMANCTKPVVGTCHVGCGICEHGYPKYGSVCPATICSSKKS